MNITKTTQTIFDCTPDSIPDEVFSSKYPVVLKGLVKNWPLTKLGNGSIPSFIDELKSQYNGKEVSAYFADNKIGGRLAYKHDVSELNFERKLARIDDLLDEIWAMRKQQNPPLRYIASNSVDLSFPQLRKKNDLLFNNDFFHKNPINPSDPIVGIWIGNRTTAPCHYDALNNIACVVAGKRKFTLFPPDQISNLYPGPLDPTPGGQAITMVDFINPDFNKFPKFRLAIEAAEVAELEAGDAIFIPTMWWHQVESLSDFNTLINYWWDTTPRINGQGMQALQHAFLSIRDRPDDEKLAWKHIFDHYIFNDIECANAHLPESARGILSPLNDRQARQLRTMLLNKLNR